MSIVVVHKWNKKQLREKAVDVKRRLACEGLSELVDLQGRKWASEERFGKYGKCDVRSFQKGELNNRKGKTKHLQQTKPKIKKLTGVEDNLASKALPTPEISVAYVSEASALQDMIRLGLT